MKNQNPDIERLKEGCLSWCNMMRAEKNLEELAELPLGRQGDPRSCPCGKATGLSVGKTCWFPIDPEGRADHSNRARDLPTIVTEFVVAFDRGQIPELIDPDAPTYLNAPYQGLGEVKQ